MATKLNIDPLIARFVRGQDADVGAVLARWEALIRHRKAENKETWSSTSILLIDHFLALPTPNAAEIERVGRFFYGITHGHPWTEQDGNDGALSDLLARDLNGKNGYRWAGGIARSKIYMLGDIAWDSSNDGYDGLAEWLSGPHCPASVRGRLAANCMRRLCQYLDNPMLYSDYLEYPRERQRNYANRMARGRLSEGMMGVAAKKTRDIAFLLGAMATHVTPGQAKLWARPPILRQLTTPVRQGASPLAPLEARLNREALAKTAGTSRIMAGKPRHM